MGEQDLSAGGGAGDATAEAQQRFANFTVELLRLLSGGGNAYNVTAALTRFVDHCVATKAPLGVTIGRTMSELYKAAFERQVHADSDMGEIALRRAALNVIIEDLTNDGFTAARRPKRSEHLRSCFDAQVMRREARSRENGWSYVAEMTKELGKWQGGKK